MNCPKLPLTGEQLTTLGITTYMITPDHIGIMKGSMWTPEIKIATMTDGTTITAESQRLLTSNGIARDLRIERISMFTATDTIKV